MSETAFPINDLLRRKLQTGLTVVSLTTCVASTLFLLIFSEQVGFGLTSISQNTLTMGISAVFSQFLIFVGGLIFAVGAIIVSFIVFLLMIQRMKDFGLMKATGCPNSLVFGYFFTELLSITFVGCILGVVLGLVVDYLIINLNIFQVYSKAPNLWFVPLVFVAFFIFAIIFGAKPIFDAAKMPPFKAISPIQYFKIGKGSEYKPLIKSGLTIRIASRSLFRRKSATLRIVFFLSVVFTLLTVSIAGGIIADDTSTSWVEKAIGKNTLLIADNKMATQYSELLLSFSGKEVDRNFNYSNNEFAIPDTVISELTQIGGVTNIDARLIWYGNIQEVAGFTIDPETLTTIKVGDSRQGTSLIVGINPDNVKNMPYTTGIFLNSSSNSYAVIGDSVSQSLYKPMQTLLPQNKPIIIGDPLVESIKIQNITLRISGICLEPLNNGNVTYILLDRLQNITGITNPNIALVSIDTNNYEFTTSQVRNTIANIDSEFVVVELNTLLENNSNFLSSLWSVIMLLPAFALAAAILCLINFHMITIEEQRQEFAIIRATGGKPKTIQSIMAIQSLIILFSSFSVGTSIGTIITIFILIVDPVISVFTVFEILVWLLVAVSIMFLLSLYPAMRFSKKTLPEILS